jgi:hypothetical protein
VAERDAQAVLRRIASRLVGETFKVMARYSGTAHAQLASVYKNPEILDLQLIEVYFGPFAGSADRRELVKRFAAAERNSDQIVAVASTIPYLPDSVTGAVGRRRPGIRLARVARPVARQPGWAAQSHDRAAVQVVRARRTSAPAQGAAQGILGKRKLEQGADGARAHVRAHLLLLERRSYVARGRQGGRVLPAVSRV